MADTTAACRSARVATATRAAKVEDRLRQRALALEPGGERGRLARGRQLAGPEQEADLLEAQGAGQVADLVAAIIEPPSRAVDLADGRARRDDVLQSVLPHGVHLVLLSGAPAGGVRLDRLIILN